MSFPPKMSRSITRAKKWPLTNSRCRSRNVGNLHIINTSVSATITNIPEYNRTVTMTPNKNVQNTEPEEVKNTLRKTPVGKKVFAAKKGAAMSFRKKKINAAKNFLKQHNKESPVKKSINSKVNIANDSSKLNLSNDNPSSSITNNISMPSSSNSNKTSNPPNGSLKSNSSNNSKTSKYKPITISHQSHSCLALYEVDKSLKAKNINKTPFAPKKDGVAPNKEKKDIVSQNKEKKDVVSQNKEKKDVVATNKEKYLVPLNKEKDIVASIKEKKNLVAPIKESKDVVAPIKEKKDIVIPIKEKKEIVIPNKEKKDTIAPNKVKKYITAQKMEKKDIVAQKEDLESTWVPIDMKITNTAKDVSFYGKNIYSANSSNIKKNQHKPVFGKNIPKERKRAVKEFPSKLSVDSKSERTVSPRYSGSSRHFAAMQEEERYYEKRYGLSRRSKARRSRYYERENKRQYRENDRYHFTRKSCETTKSFHEELEALEDVSDVPLDEDFEEVETASWEDPSKAPEIPVGFRKYKIKYLSTKRLGFFKPKRYHISQNRTVVSCLNMDEGEEEESVDVVSETGNETDCIAKGKNNKVNINDNTLETTSKSPQIKISVTAVEPVTIENSVRISEFTADKLEENCESNKQVPDSSEVLLTPTDSTDSVAMDTNLIDTAISMPSIQDKQEVISSTKFYYTCIPELDSPHFYQGHALIQKYLDEWESHLIGLEYIVEVRDMNKTQANKYYCGLCIEQLNGINTDGQIVTNHVSSYKHASSYMAKHFPSCDYKFSKIESSSNVLQSCCKEINHKLSYYFMCVTTDDYFQKHEKDVNQLLNNLPHWNETDINIDANVYVNNFESAVDKEVSQLMKDIINKVTPGEEIATFITSRNESAQELRRKKTRNSILDIQLLTDSPAVDNTPTSGRNLIVLTPQHRPVTKVASDHSRPNLLQVITHEQSDSSTDNSNKVVSKSTELSELNTKDVPATTVPSPVDSDSFNFKSINKKAVSSRKYRAKETADKANSGSKGTENKETNLRTVRKITKNSGEITVCLESKNADESAVMDDYEEVEAESDLAAEVVDDLSNESGVQILEDSTVESNFSDSLGISNNISPQDAGRDIAEVSKSKYKSKHRGHQRATTHSKHCIKRILGRNSRSGKETAIKKESSDFEVIQLDNKSNDSIESELGRRIKDLSPSDSKTSSNSRKITSPLRTRYSPVFSSDLSRMSIRRRSRSPPRRRSRSPIRRRRSLLRRLSRSPVRRRSRSPRRHSRSPVRRRSRSPKRRSRSPVRRSSRSPARRHSRSPIRRRSRSPVRKRSRSPVRRRSRSPIRRRSRSPIRRRSRSPVRRRSRSPVGRRSRSPKTSGRRKSRSPVRNRNSRKMSTSPSRRAYSGELSVSMSKHSSPLRKKYELEEASFRSDSRSSHYGDSDSRSGLHKEFTNSTHSSYSRQLQRESERDLDPISDDEEPAYFNTFEGPRHLEEIKKLPEPTRTMVMQLLQKFSASKVTPKDPSFSELMQFVNSHNSELSKPHISVNQGVPNSPTSGLALQRFLLSNLAETSSHQNLPPSHALSHPAPSFHSPHSSGVPFSPSRPDLPPSSFPQSVFPPPNVQHHGSVHHLVPPPIQQVQPSAFDNNPQVHAQIHPPQYDSFRSQNETSSFHSQNKPPSFHPQNEPPSFHPQNEPPSFHSQNQPPSFHSQNQPPSFQPKARSDGMFKDLKATVNKLFGANEGSSNEQIQLPLSREFMAQQSQSQWGKDPRNSFQQFDSLGPKNVISDDRDDSDFRNISRGGTESPSHSIGYPNKSVSSPFYPEERNVQRLHVPPPDAKVAFCDAPRAPIQKNLFPVVSSPKAPDDVKVSLAQRLAAVLVKVGMLDVPGALLQEMLMKIGAFSACPPQDISGEQIIDILRRLGYLNRY